MHSARIAELQPYLEDPAVPKAAADIKTLTLDLIKRGINPAGFTDDVSLYAFLLASDPASCGLDALVERRLDLRAGPRADERASFVHELNQRLKPEVERRNLRKLYEDIDLPLTGVLARMERTGIRIDATELARLSGLMETSIASLTADIHQIAGREFNISSPQQLGKVLFEEMNLPAPVRYGKGKVVSTAADVLALKQQIQQRVEEIWGVRLEPEPVMLGF